MIPYILNLVDLAATLHALRHGAVELNPLMQYPPIMIVYKVVGVGLLCWWLAGRRERLARIGLGIATAVYAAVDLWHIINIVWRLMT